jgi:hypothetical protein
VLGTALEYRLGKLGLRGSRRLSGTGRRLELPPAGGAQGGAEPPPRVVQG